MCFGYIVPSKITKICLHQRDGRYSGIPYKLPQKQSQTGAGCVAQLVRARAINNKVAGLIPAWDNGLCPPQLD